MTDERKAWLQERQKGIGGSDVAAILGLDGYGRQPWDVWDEKVLPVEGDEEEYGKLLRGRKLEAFAAEEFMRRTGLKVRRQPQRAHRECPVMLGNADRQIVNLPGGPQVLEIKVPDVRNFFQWRDEGLPEDKILQVQHYLEVFDYEMGRFAIFTPEYWELFTFEIARDRELGAFLRQTCETFWTEHVEARVRPTRPLPEPPSIPHVPGEAVKRGDPEWSVMADLYRERVRDYEEAKADLEAAEQGLLELVGDETNVVGAGVKVTRYSTKSQRRFDAKAFVSEFRARKVDGRALDDLDPDAPEFYYNTTPSEKQKVKVLVPFDDREAVTHGDD
jgi:putative phage-type endonuclease